MVLRCGHDQRSRKWKVDPTEVGMLRDFVCLFLLPVTAEGYETLSLIEFSGPIALERAWFGDSTLEP